MNARTKRTLSAAAVIIMAACMFFAAAAPSFAAKKKVYKIPYKLSYNNSNGSKYTQTFNIKSGRLSSVRYGGDYPSTVKLTYKSSSEIIMRFTDIDLDNTLTVKKNKVVERTGGNGVCKYYYYSNGKLKRAVIDNSTEEHGTNILQMNFYRDGKGEVKRKNEYLYDKPADDTLEPTEFNMTYTYKNTYKSGRLKTQKISYTVDDKKTTNTRTVSYKKLKMTKTQYKKYMNMWDLFNEVF
ncbi:MAG: hypothetical protein IKF54_04345 [Eubacterium sp.]|nr:hypothetical protein [Eubacterium sp.]